MCAGCGAWCWSPSPPHSPPRVSVAAPLPRPQPASGRRGRSPFFPVNSQQGGRGWRRWSWLMPQAHTWGPKSEPSRPFHLGVQAACPDLDPSILEDKVDSVPTPPPVSGARLRESLCWSTSISEQPVVTTSGRCPWLLAPQGTVPLGEMALLLSLRRGVVLWMPTATRRRPPPNSVVTVRPCCYCQLRTNPCLAPCMGPIGGKVIPDLSSVIGDELIFTKQTPMKRGWT